jgi:hypothetical protein
MAPIHGPVIGWVLLEAAKSFAYALPVSRQFMSEAQ